jgi:translation elongation factor P/translation initiation factor 5A
MIDEEIPLHMLMDEEDFDQAEADVQQSENTANNLLNVGVVLIRDEQSTEPVFL